MKIRDIIALPFLFTALLFEAIAIYIGGKYTSELFINDFKLKSKHYK